MATKFKMAAIYQNMARHYIVKLLLLMINYLKPARYGFENDAKHLTAVQQKNYTVYWEKVNFTFQNGRQSVLKLAKITEFSFYRCFESWLSLL